jgi:hypothetical protein
VDHGRTIIDATSALAGLEIGSLPGIDPYDGQPRDQALPANRSAASDE